MKKISRSFMIFLLMMLSLKGFMQDTIVFQPGPGEGKDAIVHSLYPNTNYKNCKSNIAAAWTYQGEFGIIRGLFKFDLSSLSTQLQIQSAYLNLFYNPTCGHVGHYGANSAWISKIINDWDEATVKWNNQPGTTMVNQVSLPASQSPNQNYLEISVTDIVQDMIANPGSNFGFQIRMQVEETYRSLTFASSDNLDPDLWPMLVIIPACNPPDANFNFEANGNSVIFSDSSQNATSWQWDFGDGYQSTLTNPQHTYDEPGEYEVCLIASNECGSDTACKIVRVGITDILDKSASSEIEIYPNPAVDFFVVRLPFIPGTETELQIIDRLGKIVYRVRGFLNNNNEITIDCSSLSDGIYYLRLSNPERNFTKKFLIK